MEPCRVEFESFTYIGDLQSKNTNVGQVVIILTDKTSRHCEPISYFPPETISTFSLQLLGPLISHLSGHSKDRLEYIDLTEHLIWLPNIEGYTTRLIGKIVGCEVIKRMSYTAYSFGFTPFSFFIDLYFKDDLSEKSKTLNALRLLERGKPKIKSAYLSIMGHNKNQDSEQICISRFLWENCPYDPELQCWTCYFSTEKNEE
jgi:hypothetical protein